MSELKDLCYRFLRYFLKEYFSIIFDAAMEETFKNLFELEWKQFIKSDLKHEKNEID